MISSLNIGEIKKASDFEGFF